MNIFQMKEWRKARLSYTEVRKARLEQKRKKEAEEEAEKASLPSSPNPDTSPLPLNPTNNKVTTTTMSQLYTSPTNNFQNHTGVNGIDYSALDYSLVNAFDNDTSSPFDNMLLKAMNNTEELAQVQFVNKNSGRNLIVIQCINFYQVLQPTTVGASYTVPQWTTAGSLEGMMNNMSMGKSVDDKKEENKIVDGMNETISNKRTDTVSLIVQELQRELDRPNVEVLHYFGINKVDLHSVNYWFDKILIFLITIIEPTTMAGSGKSCGRKMSKSENFKAKLFC